MIKISGYYFDGKSSQQTPVEICFFPAGEVLITGESLELKTSVQQLTIASRLGNTRRNIYLQDGAKLETNDNDSVDLVCSHFDKNILQTLIYGWEKNWHYALIALLVSVVFIWGGIEYGVPVAAKIAAKGIPVSHEEDIGKEGIDALDKWLFLPTKIDPARQEHIKKVFNNTVIELKGKYHYRLKLRSSKQMGANAIALPGGIIVITDDFIDLAENDQQIIAVLAHEIGHIEHQHGIRALFQSSFSAILMAVILGDITSITSLSAALPTMLVKSKYSRNFELEADQYAVDYLQQQNIAVNQFVKILDRLAQQHKSEIEFDYLSSHPAMGKRIEQIREY